MNALVFRKLVILLSTLLIFASVSPNLVAAKKPPGIGLRVAGSYLLDANLTGTDGTPLDVQALATLAADGGVVATDTDDFGFGTGAFYHSPKQGAWKFVGRHAISITVLEFAFDNAGNLITVFWLNFLAKFDDREFETGGGSVFFKAFLPGQDPLDANSVAIATGEGDFTFQRIAP